MLGSVVLRLLLLRRIVRGLVLEATEAVFRSGCSIPENPATDGTNATIIVKYPMLDRLEVFSGWVFL